MSNPEHGPGDSGEETKFSTGQNLVRAIHGPEGFESKPAELIADQEAKKYQAPEAGVQPDESKLVQDPEKALDMAYAEKPHIEHAKMWNKEYKRTNYSNYRISEAGSYLEANEAADKAGKEYDAKQIEQNKDNNALRHPLKAIGRLFGRGQK